MARSRRPAAADRAGADLAGRAAHPQPGPHRLRAPGQYRRAAAARAQHADGAAGHAAHGRPAARALAAAAQRHRALRRRRGLLRRRRLYPACQRCAARAARPAGQPVAGRHAHRRAGAPAAPHRRHPDHDTPALLRPACRRPRRPGSAGAVPAGLHRAAGQCPPQCRRRPRLLPARRHPGHRGGPDEERVPDHRGPRAAHAHGQRVRLHRAAAAPQPARRTPP
mmetsp:Transcript_37820/g.105385  ORF Transcript_37820/g.105385 Transcript_37820/m.105385 type:complete len:223 (+) Transcript_37820:2218-2886(+)